MTLSWEQPIKDKFEQMLAKIPGPLRGIAEGKIRQTAEKLAGENNRTSVNEKDLVDAFFTETPFGFHGPMKTDMESLDIDYTQYGYDK